jgi:hypothetical protein
VDLGPKPVTDFKNIPPHVDDLTQPHLQAITHPSQEGLQDDKQDPTNHPQTIPVYILHPQHRPKHHRPDLIRAVGYPTNLEGRLIQNPTYRGRRQIQIIECKSSTDCNILKIIDYIYQLYEPLKAALQTHGNLKADIIIIPIVISRTCTLNVKTLAEITQLVSYKEEPPDTMTYKQLPNPAKQIAMALHTYTQEWLSHISKNACKILTTKSKKQTFAIATLP